MIRSFGTKSPENYILLYAITGVAIAAVLTLIPTLAFGTFWQMAAIFLVADLVGYIAIKTGLLKWPRVRR
jgi:hypothetical protein